MRNSRAYFSTAFLTASEMLTFPHAPMKAPMRLASSEELCGIRYAVLIDRNFHYSSEWEYLVKFTVDGQALGSKYERVCESRAEAEYEARQLRASLPEFVRRITRQAYGIAN